MQLGRVGAGDEPLGAGAADAAMARERTARMDWNCIFVVVEGGIVVVESWVEMFGDVWIVFAVC